MESLAQKTKRVAIALAVAAVMMFFGYAMFASGYRILHEWSSISPAYAGVGVLWFLAGPGMFGAGLWVLGSLGRHRIPLWIGGTAAILAGVVLIVGVLTYVVPCSGPS
jgi:hypothetical protein